MTESPHTAAPVPESPPPGGLSAVTKRPGFAARFLHTVDRANLPLLASALTFDALLAVIPMAVLVVGGLGLLLDHTRYFGAADPALMIARFFPRAYGDADSGSIGVMQSVLEGIRAYRGQLTVYAIPAFLWFSTRLFGSIRSCLSKIFDVKTPVHHRGVVIGYLVGYVRGKLWDFVTVGGVLGLALLSTVLTAGLTLLSAEEERLVPPWTFLVTTLGQVLAQGLAFGSGLVLFILLYRYASPKRMAWKGALLAGSVAALAFELAKYLYGLYLGRVAHSAQFSMDANAGAVLLVILWIWYTALVFLGGAAIADAWDRGRHQVHPEAPPLLEPQLPVSGPSAPSA